MNFIDIMAIALAKKNPSELVTIANSGNVVAAAAAAQAMKKTVQKSQDIQAAIQASLPSDSEILRVINEEIATPWLGLPLTPAMGQQYLSQFKNYISQGMSPDQAFDNINAEFERATDAEDVAFYESRTGNIISGGSSGSSPNNNPSLPYQPSVLPNQSNVRTAGASGNNDLLIYGAIAAVGLYLIFGQRGGGLSGVKSKTTKKTSSRKPATRTKTKKKTGSSAKGRPAAKATKKSGRMQVIDL